MPPVAEEGRFYSPNAEGEMPHFSIQKLSSDFDSFPIDYLCFFSFLSRLIQDPLLEIEL